MNQALHSARILAAYYGAAIGECLTANQVADSHLSTPSVDASVWLVCFDIINGPKDWCWVAMISAAGQESVFYASNVRPTGGTLMAEFE
ncbi:MAG TPA: hypothetical protein VGJ26_07815 [Pirellulales bacterium]